MSFRTYSSCVGVLLLAVSVGVAQEQGSGGEANRPDQEPPGGRRMRELRFVHQPSDPAKFQEALEKVVTLDDAQRETIKKLLSDHHEKITKVSETGRQTDEELAAMKQLSKDIVAARDAGDNDRVVTLVDQMKALREAREQKRAPALQEMEAAHRKLHDDVAAALKVDQRDKFEKFWAEQFADAGGQRRSRAVDPQRLKMLVERLDDLTSTQKQSIETLFQTFKDADRANSRQTASSQPAGRMNDRANRRQLATKLYDDVVAVLTPAQAEKLEKQLHERDNRHGRPGGPRGLRAPRGPRDSEPPAKPEGGQSGKP